MRLLTESITKLGIEVVPSEANFVMIVLADSKEADRIALELLQKGIIVRPLKAWGLPNCLRISTGTDQDNQRCVEAIEKAVIARAV